MTIEQILEAIEQMKVTELNELVKAAEEKFGVSASAPVMVAGAAGGALLAAAAVPGAPLPGYGCRDYSADLCDAFGEKTDGLLHHLRGVHEHHRVPRRGYQPLPLRL